MLPQRLERDARCVRRHMESCGNICGSGTGRAAAKWARRRRRRRPAGTRNRRTRAIARTNRYCTLLYLFSTMSIHHCVIRNVFEVSRFTLELHGSSLKPDAWSLLTLRGTGFKDDWRTKNDQKSEFSTQPRWAPLNGRLPYPIENFQNQISPWIFWCSWNENHTLERQDILEETWWNAFHLWLWWVVDHRSGPRRWRRRRRRWRRWAAGQPQRHRRRRVVGGLRAAQILLRFRYFSPRRWPIPEAKIHSCRVPALLAHMVQIFQSKIKIIWFWFRFGTSQNNRLSS